MGIYGAGNAPNRKIEFYGDGNQIWRDFFGKRSGIWQKIVKIDETQMNKEMASTKEKVRIMVEAKKKGVRAEYPADQDFNILHYEEKVRIISNLQPTGNYHICISNEIGSNPFFEEVVRLSFFDPM